MVNSQVTPPYRIPRVDQADISVAHTFMNITGPQELIGTLAVAPSPTSEHTTQQTHNVHEEENQTPDTTKHRRNKKRET